MSSLVVGGVAIPVAPGSGSWDWSDAVDRRRAFDNTYRASATGGAARDGRWTTPPVTRANAAIYRAALQKVDAQLCTGDLIEIPTMCCSELIDERPVKVQSGSYVSLDFALHEVQGKKLLLKYSPGDTITGESFSRSTAGEYMTGPATVASAAIDVKRASHRPYPDVSVLTLLLEGSRANLLIRSEEFDNAAWSKGAAGGASAPVVTADLGAAPDGASTADKVVFAATGAGQSSTLSQTLSVAAATNYAGSFYVRAWAAGDIGKTILFRGVGGSAYTAVVLTDTFQRVSAFETSASTTGQLELTLRPDSGSSSGTVSILLWGAQLEPGATASSYIKTTTATATRAADSYSLPFGEAPREMTVYIKFRESGTYLAAGRVFEIANAGDSDPRFLVYSPGGAYTVYHGKSGSAVTSNPGVSPAVGDTVEIVARLFGDGSVDIVQSLNNAAAVTGSQSAALPLAAAWSDQKVWLNSAGTAGGYGYIALVSFKIVAGSRSLSEMRAA